MKNFCSMLYRYVAIPLLYLCIANAHADTQEIRRAYEKAKLTERQAASYLVDRFSFGARPGDVDRIITIGIDRWFAQQLEAKNDDTNVQAKLKSFPALQMNDQQLFARYPSGSLVTAHARRFYDLVPPAGTPVDFDWVRRKTDKFRQEHDILDERALHDQLIGQKIIRATYSENQLTEVMTDFWMNHFYTSPMSFRARPWVFSYERDAIRPRVLGKFKDLLLAAEKHPAMLQYLENAQSALVTNDDSLMNAKKAELIKGSGNRDSNSQLIAQAERDLQQVEDQEQIILDKKFRPREGVNENFARVLINAHTLGLQGNQTPNDITAAARIFSGWTTMPMGITDQWFAGGFSKADTLGFKREGGFLFRADWHDAKEKIFFGKRFKAGQGVEEGEVALAFLAGQPATARNIAQKIATRFVSDVPSKALVDNLTKVFINRQGDIKFVLQALVTSPEFWKASQEKTKVKSPFHLAISAIRANDVEVSSTKELAEWIGRMGQPLYAYQASPTGFPDRADFWMTAGNLLQRINFASAFASGEIDLANAGSANVATSNLAMSSDSLQTSNKQEQITSSEKLPPIQLNHIKQLIGSPQFQTF